MFINYIVLSIFDKMATHINIYEDHINRYEQEQEEISKKRRKRIILLIDTFITGFFLGVCSAIGTLIALFVRGVALTVANTALTSCVAGAFCAITAVYGNRETLKEADRRAASITSQSENDKPPVYIKTELISTQSPIRLFITNRLAVFAFGAFGSVGALVMLFFACGVELTLADAAIAALTGGILCAYVMISTKMITIGDNEAVKASQNYTDPSPPYKQEWERLATIHSLMNSL
jgi:hypothetical protein